MNVLVLGPARHSHVALRELGCTIALITRKKAYASNNAIAKEDYNFPYSVVHLLDEQANKEAFIRIAKFLHENHHFEAVCCFHDEYQQIGVSVATALSLPTFYDPALLERVIHKDLTREKLAAAGIENTEFSVVQQGSEVADAACRLGFPLILKPTSATGSRGVRILRSEADVESAVQYYQEVEATYPAIVERYFEGQEFSVEAFSEGGQHKIFSITQKFVDPITRIEIGHLTPAPLNLVQKAQIEDYVSSILSALELINGPSHSEIILTEQGPRLIETHSRIGGDRIWDLVKFSSGIDMPLLSAKQAIGQKVFQDPTNITPTLKKFAAIWYLFPKEGQYGTLDSIEHMNDALNVRDVVEVKTLMDKGSTVKKVSHSFERVAKCIAVSDSSEIALRAAQQAVEKLLIKLA